MFILNIKDLPQLFINKSDKIGVRTFPGIVEAAVNNKTFKSISSENSIQGLGKVSPNALVP